jgi:hypothetical protein
MRKTNSLDVFHSACGARPFRAKVPTITDAVDLEQNRPKAARNSSRLSCITKPLTPALDFEDRP